MKRKLAACILTLLIGTVVTTNANAFICKAFNDSIKSSCDNACGLIKNEILKGLCL
ncbi:hypothetical protein Xkoz_01889 [Xenorhabdus kozodoii]|uniref:Uncharacterized protein n=1 Tax=Xenorhabdus kozodoii TaxID=351676 RepID=A0A2D0LCW5_9GAMM|nr:hypothetical protein Xkoz_01889 [Xenorhabdus kozodoii]